MFFNDIRRKSAGFGCCIGMVDATVDRMTDPPPQGMATIERRCAMNRLATSAFVATLTAAFALPALAADHRGEIDRGRGIHDGLSDQQPSSIAPNAPRLTFAAAESKEIRQILRHWKGGPLTVTPVASLDSSAEGTVIERNRTDDPAHVAALQKTVESNPALMQALKSDGVETDTIIGADRAANGGVTIYVD
jgi:hypothetical protein